MRQQINDSAARPDSVGAAVLRTGASSNGQQRVAIVTMRGKSFAREGGKSEGSTEWARLLSNRSTIAALGRKGVTLAVVLCTQGNGGRQHAMREATGHNVTSAEKLGCWEA